MNPSISDLRELSPNLIDIPDNDFAELLAALDEKGFEWNSREKYFSNGDLNKVIDVGGLHSFDARSIREEWGNREFMIGYSNQTFLTKFQFWGVPLLSILTIILFILGKYANGVVLLIFTVMMYYLVETARKYYFTKKESGFKPSTISSVLIVLFLINMVILFTVESSKVGEFTFVILGLSGLLFFFRIKID